MAKALIGKAFLSGYFKSPIQLFGKPRIIVKNRLNKNLARIVASAIDRSDRNIDVEEEFTDVSTITLNLNGYDLDTFKALNADVNTRRSGVFGLAYGSGTTPETLDDKNLVSGEYHVTANYWDIVEETDKTKILIASHHRPPKTFNCYEAAVGRITPRYNPHSRGLAFFSRVTFTTPITITEGENRFDGWEIIFNNNFSKWFVRALLSAMIYNSEYIKDINGNSFSILHKKPIQGMPKIRLGDGTTTPSPDDHGLSGSELAVLDATLSLTEDVTNDILRISARATFTPTSDLQVNEIALFTTVKDEAENLHEILVARYVFLETQTLKAGTTYTVGIDLIF